MVHAAMEGGGEVFVARGGEGVEPVAVEGRGVTRAVGRPRAGGMVDAGGRADSPSTSISSKAAAALGLESGRRRFGSIRASLLLSSQRRAPGPPRLALLAGAGAGVVGAGGAGGAGEGAWISGSASCLLGWQPPLLGAWLPSPGICTFRVTWRSPSQSL